MSEMVEIVEHGTVRELRLARPPVNALAPELVAALTAALAPPLGTAGPAALVLSGSPGIFSAGLDVPLLLRLDRAGIGELWSSFYALLRSLAASPVPVVAAITGHSPAGGAVLALFCDVRIMAAGDFRIGLNEVRVGLPLPPVIFAAMRRQVGARLAERLCVSGALVSAEEALRVGLVDELSPAEQVVERAIAVARELAALPPAAMSETRRLARADLVALFDGVAGAEVPAVLDAWFTAEAQTTMRAMVEKLARKRGEG
jgi:3,2-trans-enoyl-CoA isomerase